MREYRCDCGTLFSRRDSFITHRAFCDALAQESAKNPPSSSNIGSHLYGSSNNMSLGGLSKINSQISDHHDIFHFGGCNNNNNNNNMKNITSGGPHHHHHNQFDHNNNLIGSSSAFRPSTSFFRLPADQTSHQDYTGNNKQSIHGLMQLPDLHNNAKATSSPSMFNLNFFKNNNNVDNDNSNISGDSGGLLLPSPHQFSNNSGESSNNSSNVFSAGTLLSDHHHMSSSIPSLYGSSSLHHQNNNSPAPPMSASGNNSTFVSATGGGGSSSSAMKSDTHPPPAVNFDGVYGYDDSMSCGNHLHDLVVNVYGAQEQYHHQNDYEGVIGGYNNKGWFYFHTGHRWFVNFWKGKANGEGRFYSKLRDVFFGHFKDGLRHGQCLCINIDGMRSIEVWDEGLLQRRKNLDSDTETGWAVWRICENMLSFGCSWCP
ncbi:hypothetical protein K7X08_007857 [Anisodus acutangulus]|uniref:BIRD-IDD transcription factor fourth C2HC zinc finger domain-containing protein n=1 Tax=Anisodus acutangulus TaxID=402998 RepID=A0A9Q1RNT3_9SOLA|nr:hypothetical protein K7X08_007857 [Anisodus acutangulus]